jgi:hypothetical protein
VTISGKFSAGDVAALKSSFYPGWKLDGREALNVGNMIGAQIPSDTTSITFRFDPLDMKIAAIISGIGIIILVTLVIKRREIEKYLTEAGKSPVQKQERKKKKR